jgi:proteasome lid subunit RPN8/RPN11
VESLVRIRRQVFLEIANNAHRDAGLECCGLLAGSGGVITQAFPTENAAAHPSKNYEIAPREIVRLLREFRAQGLEFLGIYHSHPKGENTPSPRDIEFAYYSEAAYFIVSPLLDAAKPVRAFSIRDGRATELEIEIL